MNQTCQKCQSPFEITAEDQKFYAKFSVPEPKTCPRCRLTRRLCERNTRNLYKRPCSFSKKTIISQYHADHPFPVYDSEIWWGDQWDALDYGQEFDFNRPFFEQFKELQAKTPHIALFIIGGTLQNSDFTNCTGYLKNCYLICESDYDEDCYYSNLLKKCLCVVDCSTCYDNELCYECIDCQKCYGLQHCQDCEQCQDSYFLTDCKACHNCIGCINLRHKEFHIFNQPYSETEYAKKKAELDLETVAGRGKLHQTAQEFFQTQPHQDLQQENNQNCFGDHLYHSKNAFYCFDSKDLEDCRYCARLSLQVKSSMDYNSWGDKAELIYQCSGCGDNIYNLKFCGTCTTNFRDSEYCHQCTGSSHLFGCIGLKRQKYCILNKKYSQDEYEKLVARIKTHMRKTGEYGEYFPYDLSPFGYNESIAMDYFPLTKEEAFQKSFKWTEKEKKRQPQTCQIPEKIADVTDKITEETLACVDCAKNYRIIPQELKFYRQLNIPTPLKCPDCRHLGRMKLRPPRQFWDRTCSQCQAAIQTTYSPESPEKVYCEQCYRKTVI